MADRGRMKGVEGGEGGSGAGEGAEGRDGEAREELELALSLGRRGWHLPAARREPPPPPAAMRWTMPPHSWDHDAAGSSRAATHVPPLRCRDIWHGDNDAGGAIEGAEEGDEEDEEGDEDGDRDLQSKRPKVRGFGEESPQHSGVNASFFGLESTHFPGSDEHGHFKLSHCPENELDFGLSLFPNDGVNENPGDGNVGDVEISGGENSEDVEIRMDLSDDLLHLIFSFLGQRDLCKAGASCKQWRSASMHEDFWKCLKFENTRISLQNFVDICHRYQNVTYLNLSGVPHAELLVMEAITCLRHLKTLIMGKGQLGEAFFQLLSECPLLTTLTVSDASLGSGIQEVTVNHDGLRELQILKCRALRISVRCSQLQILSLRRTGMAHVSLNCPQLVELDFQSCHKLSDNAIRQAATACPLLASLDMSSCSCVTDETLREIANSCPNLSVLDASNCPNISFESVRLPMLVDLRLLSCEGITSASMAAIAYSRLLEALQLDNCSLLTSVSLDLPHLKNISLVHLRKFAELTLRSPVLSYIKVSRCSVLHRVSITSNALQKLVLQKQESLSSLSLLCNNLIDVDLSDCESLTNAVCEVFSDGGGCPLLRSLILDNCESLSTVELNSSSMVNLSLAGCRSMTLLKLSCPNLQNVNLDGCDHLERASFCPVGLESLNLGICPKLSDLHIEAPKMSLLELKGCGVLSQASINCPRLTSLDASFCRKLMDDSLSQTAEACPLIENLILSSCVSIDLNGLSSLHCLHKLALLDLSYTFLTNLKPVFDSCPQLKILKLSACKYLSDSSLDALYREGALPMLVELDLSYSSIGQTAIEELLSCCTNLVNVNLNGCTNLHQLVCGSDDCSSGDMPVDVCPPDSAPVRSEEISERRGWEDEDSAFKACTMLQDEELESAISRCSALEILNVHSCPKINVLDFSRLRVARNRQTIRYPMYTRNQKTFRPKKNAPSGNKGVQLKKHIDATLGSGNLRDAVRLPPGEDLNEWLAVNTVDFFNQVNILYGTLMEFCTPTTCPTMSAGPKFEYRWADGIQIKKPIEVSAPKYVEYLMDWIEVQLDDESIFPQKLGTPFPQNFREVVKTIFKRLFRVYAHIYHTHFQKIVSLKEEAHLNTCFKHFTLFTWEFKLIDKAELAPLIDLIESIVSVC
uniref:F-box protein family n=1 Tax=Oryza sativa subsp. japonica TaxID=39947 RepID=Q8S5N8_ORYSJ|nr:Putative F-box protein family [Oryza sativa Japonica Group]AAM44890.1 Putative F-box protein family [Oryza sativa Japonica Group]